MISKDDVIGYAKRDIKQGETFEIKITPNGLQSDDIEITMDENKLLDFIFSIMNDKTRIV